jgi:hypothetical protein
MGFALVLLRVQVSVCTNTIHKILGLLIQIAEATSTNSFCFAMRTCWHEIGNQDMWYPTSNLLHIERVCKHLICRTVMQTDASPTHGREIGPVLILEESSIGVNIIPNALNKQLLGFAIAGFFLLVCYSNISGSLVVKGHGRLLWRSTMLTHCSST